MADARTITNLSWEQEQSDEIPLQRDKNRDNCASRSFSEGWTTYPYRLC